MRARSEEEPDPEEEPSPEPPASATATMVPAVSTPGRESEYRTQLVTAAEVVDGSTLAEQLTKASAEGWDLVEIIGAGDRHAILLRRPKDQNRESRAGGGFSWAKTMAGSEPSLARCSGWKAMTLWRPPPEARRWRWQPAASPM